MVEQVGFHNGYLGNRNLDELHSLRVQVPNNQILTQDLYYNSYYPNPKYLILAYMDPLGSG